MKYQLTNLQMFATPNAEKMFEFNGLPQVEFEFPGMLRTALAISCGLVRASRHGGEDHYEVVFRLYESANPRETGENHIGKLYIRVFGYPGNYRFQPYIERFEWHPDGSFDVIAPDGAKIFSKNNKR